MIAAMTNTVHGQEVLTSIVSYILIDMVDVKRISGASSSYEDRLLTICAFPRRVIAVISVECCSRLLPGHYLPPIAIRTYEPS
jgi:hypothetical protein